jgi:anti-sigma factor RsiW
MNELTDLHALIQADVDGVATEKEKARLHEVLARDAEARAEHARLRDLREFLATIAPEEPPAELVSRVMRRIRAERAPAPRSGLVGRLFGFWPGGRVAIPFAYAAAAGAAIGVLGYHVLVGGGALGPDAIERDAAATIGSAPMGVETGRLALVAGRVSGSAALRELDGSFALDVELPAGGPLDVSVAYDPAAVKFIGISNRTGGVDQIAIADGTVRWSQDRPQRVTVFLTPRSPAASRVQVRFEGEGGIGGGGSMDLPGRH